MNSNYSRKKKMDFDFDSDKLFISFARYKEKKELKKK